MLYGLAVVLVGVVQWSLFRHETNDGLARPTTRHRLGADQHKQPTQPSTRFLIFRPPFEAAQGVGNIMQGLLAAHALGFEFDRVVCVSHEWEDFLGAFDMLDPLCASLTLPEDPMEKHKHTLWLLSFGKLPVNECRLKQRLGGTEPFLYIVANTYPRWPRELATKVTFENHYRLRADLQKVLPWKAPPSTVVHLRQPDDPAVDPRAGLEPETLKALGDKLPSLTFLVTNQVSYYQYFESNFGWSHPPWTGVRHSAKPKLSWGATKNRKEELLELWSDWWTLYKAKQVYHTHSDFSLSAINWSGKDDNSYSIQGVSSEGDLSLEQRATAQTKILPLIQRAELKNCHIHPSGLDGISYAMDLDVEYHDDLLDD